MLSIAALKKVSKGTKILLLDRNGGQSKAVAKELAKKGFKKVCGPAQQDFPPCVLQVLSAFAGLLSSVGVFLKCGCVTVGLCCQRWIQRMDIFEAADQVFVICKLPY